MALRAGKTVRIKMESLMSDPNKMNQEAMKGKFSLIFA
jgi:hypothetical protein